MKLPFDIEDIIGVALADILKRALGFFGSLLLGAVLAAISVGVIALDPGSILAAPVFLLLPVFSSWGILYLPLVLGIVVYWIKADSPGLRGLTVAGGLVMILVILSFPDLDWERWAALGVGLGSAGALVWLGWWWQQKQRAEAEEHLRIIAIENEQRRQEARERFGTDVADGDYAVPMENRMDPPGRE